MTAQANTAVAQASPPTDVFVADFWRSLAPKLTIEGGTRNHVFSLAQGQKDPLRKKLVQEGYIHLEAPEFQVPFDLLAESIQMLVSRGLPPVFIFLYDQAWMVNYQMQNLLRDVFHEEYQQLPDFWAWCVRPGQAGWTPHRDKLTGSLFPDKTPKSVTVWVPITQAHPLNGCMYLLPANRDKFYGVEPANPQHEMSLQDIRALPANAGDVLMWTQNVLHWGGHSADEHHLSPRMSMAFEYQRSDVPAFNQPLLAVNDIPSFARRLSLVAKQILQYRHMYGFSAELSAAAEEILQKLPL